MSLRTFDHTGLSVEQLELRLSVIQGIRITETRKAVDLERTGVIADWDHVLRYALEEKALLHAIEQVYKTQA